MLHRLYELNATLYAETEPQSIHSYIGRQDFDP